MFALRNISRKQFFLAFAGLAVIFVFLAFNPFSSVNAANGPIDRNRIPSNRGNSTSIDNSNVEIDTKFSWKKDMLELRNVCPGWQKGNISLINHQITNYCFHIY